MSSRRNGSVSRAAETASKNRLHMDRNPQHARITDPSNPAGRRKEIDNVMKRARQASPGSWDRKLLEVEEKDPNRWRHTGYKQMYLDHSGSGSPRRSRSPGPRRSRSPVGRRSRSPLPRRSRSPIVRRSRSPIVRRSRSPIVRRSRSPIVRRSRSPIVRRSRSPIRREIPRREPRRTPPRRSPIRRSPIRRRGRSPPAPAPPPPPPGPAPGGGGLAAARARPPPRTRPPSPPDPRRSSGSGSSVSSCSDESCSVCSAKNRKPPPPPQPQPQPRDKVSKPPPPTRPQEVARAKRPAVSGSAGNSSRAVQPTRELLKAREASKRSREEKVLEWQRSQMAVNSRPAPIPPAHIKREGERRPPPPQYGGAAAGGGGGSGGNAGGRKRAVSPAAIAAALADTASDTESEASDHPPPRLTLSERFGKMAQWSADRSALSENMNMKITRRDSALHVHIAREDPPPRTDCPSLDGGELGVGSYPSELLAVAPAGLSWDDVRVRYDYYKKRGYLRGLTLSDYVKWEDWWYKYQEWLKRERAYERWAEGELTGNVRRERRRRGGRHRRS